MVTPLDGEVPTDIRMGPSIQTQTDTQMDTAMKIIRLVLNTYVKEIGMESTDTRRSGTTYEDCDCWHGL
jgi:hypothetical protein